MADRDSTRRARTTNIMRALAEGRDLPGIAPGVQAELRRVFEETFGAPAPKEPVAGARRPHPKPYAGDPDRLFAASLLEYGALAALRDAGKPLLAMCERERRAAANDFAARLRETSDEPREERVALQRIVDAMCEIEACEAIERVRSRTR